jgi:hypothetical protein
MRLVKPKSGAAKQLLRLLNGLVQRTSEHSAFLASDLLTPQVLAVLILCIHRARRGGPLSKQAARDIQRLGLFASSSAKRCAFCFDHGDELFDTAFGSCSACSACCRRYCGAAGDARLLTGPAEAVGTLADALLDAGHSKLLRVLESCCVKEEEGS